MCRSLAEPDSGGIPRRTSLRKNGLQRPAKGGFHPCFCLPACCNCPVALSEFTALILMIQLCLNLTASKNAIAAGKTNCKIRFASQMWATRPHLGSIFKKLLHRKTFICLRLAPSSPIYIPLTKKSRTYRPALPHAAFALIRFFRTIQPVNHLPASASDNLFQSLCS